MGLTDVTDKASDAAAGAADASSDAAAVLTDATDKASDAAAGAADASSGAAAGLTDVTDKASDAAAGAADASSDAAAVLTDTTDKASDELDLLIYRPFSLRIYEFYPTPPVDEYNVECLQALGCARSVAVACLRRNGGDLIAAALEASDSMCVGSPDHLIESG